MWEKIFLLSPLIIPYTREDSQECIFMFISIERNIKTEKNLKSQFMLLSVINNCR